LSADQISQIKLLKGTRAHYEMINVQLSMHQNFNTPTAKVNIELETNKFVFHPFLASVILC